MQEIICFHRPEEENGYLSNWYSSAFEKGCHRFSSMEQYMMWSKAMVFQDSETAEAILKAAAPGEIKALGRSVRNYGETVWNGLRQIVVHEGLLEKFRQNRELLSSLEGTGDAILAECAVGDRIWGIGLSMRDSRRLSTAQCRGHNLLGFALMRVRLAFYVEEWQFETGILTMKFLNIKKLGPF